jgi:hypothetical protein
MRTEGFNDITKGLIKAAMNIAAQARKPFKSKFTYEDVGKQIHWKRMPTQAERDGVEAIMAQMADVKDGDVDSMTRLMSELGKFPITFAQVKYEKRITTSKTYPYASNKRRSVN